VSSSLPDSSVLVPVEPPEEFCEFIGEYASRSVNNLYELLGSIVPKGDVQPLNIGLDDTSRQGADHKQPDGGAL